MNPKEAGVSDQLKKLLQPYSLGGLFGSMRMQYSVPEVSPGVVHCSPDLGNVAAVWPNPEWYGNALKVNAGGSGLCTGDALLPALVEGLERYSAGICRETQLIEASAEELGEEAIDLDSIPRCSQRELAHPKCPLILPDKRQAIRWVRGLSLMDGRTAYVPAVMVYSHIINVQPSERFWLPISTGCAAHTTYEEALLGGICEVVERDAISITWLQKLQLPQIEVDVVPPELAGCWEVYESGSGKVETHFLDATLDLGIPTVYAVQVARFSKQTATLIGCSSKSSMAKAMAKVILDLAAFTQGFRPSHPLPQSWDDYSQVMHGATYMAQQDRRHAFDFLLASSARKKLSDILKAESHGESLMRVLQNLKAKALACYAIDISPDEAMRTGIRVVRVVIPGLQPLSFRYRARFLGHPRLYDAPRRMGFRSLPEEKVNDFPQPFA